MGYIKQLLPPKNSFTLDDFRVMLKMCSYILLSFVLLLSMPHEFIRDHCTKIDEWVEKKIHNLWCSETLLFIPALKEIPKELIARASPIKATSPGAIRKQQQQQQQHNITNRHHESKRVNTCRLGIKDKTRQDKLFRVLYCRGPNEPGAPLINFTGKCAPSQVFLKPLCLLILGVENPNSKVYFWFQLIKGHNQLNWM